MKIDVISAAVIVFCLGICVTLISEIKSTHKTTATALVAETR